MAAKLLMTDLTSISFTCWNSNPSVKSFPEIYQLYTAYMFFLTLAFKIDKKALSYEQLSEHFSYFFGEKPSILVGKQKQLKYSSLLDVRFTIYLTHKSYEYKFF